MPRKHTPDQPSTQTEAVTAGAAPGSAERNEEKPTFSERVGRKGQRTTVPDPFGIAGDYVAGVRLFESKQDRQMAIQFDELAAVGGDGQGIRVLPSTGAITSSSNKLKALTFLPPGNCKRASLETSSFAILVALDHAVSVLKPSQTTSALRADFARGISPESAAWSQPHLVPTLATHR